MYPIFRGKSAYFLRILWPEIRPKLRPKLRWIWPKLRGSAELNFGWFGRSLVSIHFKSIWYRYFFNHFLGLISVFIAFLCDNFCRNSKVTIIMFKNNVKRFLKCEILSIMENFYFWFDKNLNFLEYFGQKGVKYYQKKYRQHKMYWYTDTFSMKNVSMCRYRYILKVSDTDTVSNTKGLIGGRINR